MAAWLLTAAVVTGCGSEVASREEVLTDLVDQAIVPAYERMATSARGLEHAAAALCDAVQSGASPDDALAGLDEARAALSDSVARWSVTEAMWLGPVMERRSWAVIDWPVNADEIEALIADGEPIDAERLAMRIGADQRGLRAVEHILGTAADTRRHRNSRHRHHRHGHSRRHRHRHHRHGHSRHRRWDSRRFERPASLRLPDGCHRGDSR